MRLALLLFTLLPFTLLPPIPRDAPGAVDGWRETFEDERREVDESDLDRLETLLIDLRGYGRLSSAHRRLAGRTLLDLYGAGLEASRGSARARTALGWRVVELAGREFRALTDAELERWVAEEVLVLATENPVPRRAAAAHLLGDSGSSDVLKALKVCARSSEPALRAAAFEALVGRGDPGVHRVFLRALREADASTPALLLGAAEAHFRRARLPEDSPLVPVLEGYVRERLVGGSWRRASRGASVSAGLPEARAVPLLIEGMEAWGEGDDGTRPVKRVQYDILRELQARSELDLGLRPERWRTWWEARRGGQARPATDGEARTESSFFGLRPTTDRLVFVLDRSGSMSRSFPPSEPVGEREWTRYEEAVERMVRYLESLGPEARFDVVLFADGAQRWRRELQPADRTHLRAARSWALRRPPEGGTQLRHGIEAGLRLEPDGTVDLDALEADTLVVLCDGETDEGDAWVVPVLRRVNPRARVVIHGVQLGKSGDGTLELLAETTGGEFVVVDG